MRTSRTLARILATAGLPALTRRARGWRRAPGRALVLMYHRVADEIDYLGMCVPPAVFEQQIALLRQRTRVVPLSALVERLASPMPLEEDFSAVTFDDGYQDNLDYALPILERYGVAATVFVTTGFVDGSAQPNGERLRRAFAALWERAAGPYVWPDRRQEIDGFVRVALTRRGSLSALRNVNAALKRLPWGDSEEMIRQLEEIAAVRTCARRTTLDWSAVRSLAARGIEIASHTVSHPILTRVSVEDAERELRLSKERLEAATGVPVVGFAFPNGAAADFTVAHIELLQRLGYRYACTAIRGTNRPGDDPFRLRRIGIGCDSPALFDLKLALGGRIHACAA